MKDRMIIIINDHYDIDHYNDDLFDHNDDLFDGTFKNRVCLNDLLLNPGVLPTYSCQVLTHKLSSSAL